MAARKRAKSLRSDSKSLVYKIIKFCDEESENGDFLIPVTNTTERASKISGLGMTTIKKIRNEALKQNGEPVFSSPKKKVKLNILNRIKLDQFDCDVIRRTVHDFYIREKKVPTLSKLLPVVKEKINFPRGKEYLRQVLNEIGFKWKKSQDKRKILMEREDIALKRVQFLRKMEVFREEKRPIVYIDETWIDSNLTFNKCWQSKETDGVIKTGNASRRIIVLCAGGAMGFLPNSNLIYKANTSKGDYHGQMNSHIYEKWTQEKLIPNLPANAVVIIDNAPYHSVQTNKSPNSNSTKKSILEWLDKNGISHSKDSLRIELLELVKYHAPKDKTYRFDSMLAEHGFAVLRLPPYHCDINAIEYVWAEVKQYVRNINPLGDLNMEKLLKSTEDAISSISVVNWIKYCERVKKLEAIYREKDQILDELCEPLRFTVNDSDSSTDSEADEDM